MGLIRPKAHASLDPLGCGIVVAGWGPWRVTTGVDGTNGLTCGDDGMLDFGQASKQCFNPTLAGGATSISAMRFEIAV